jgi:type VI secretion system ImpM family protein
VSRWIDGAAVLGKVEWEYEFLRSAGLASPLRSFDEWLFRNASSGQNDSWHSGGEEPSIYAFVMQPAPGEQAIAGVVGPSRDRAGRAYPAAIVSSLALEEAAAHPEVLPIVLEDYWQTAVEGLTAVRGAPFAGDDRRLIEMTREPLATASDALDLYVAWTQRTTPGELCELLDRSTSWLEHAVDALARAVRPSRDRVAASGAVRVPLGRAAGGALCFWLDVLRRAAAAPGRCPSFFWSHDARTGDALLSLAPPPDATLGTLWGLPTTASSSGGLACDLTRTGEPSASSDPGLGSLELGAPGLGSLGLGGQGEETLAAMLEMVG